ncbi:hypothetical protein QWA68_002904 [Fusarium oxysporum]|nr:hypothetical protein QWA68_002904 [Fusarium oxysporum]
MSNSTASSVAVTKAQQLPPITLGGYNVLYPVRCDGDGFDIVVRQPCPDLVQFREEKTRDEGATISYLA